MKVERYSLYEPLEAPGMYKLHRNPDLPMEEEDSNLALGLLLGVFATAEATKNMAGGLADNVANLTGSVINNTGRVVMVVINTLR